MNINDLYEKSLAIDEKRTDILSPINNIFADGKNLVVKHNLAGDFFAPLQKRAFRHLSTFLKGTKKDPLTTNIGRAVDYLFDDCPPELFEENVNYWLELMPPDKPLLLRGYDYGNGDEIRAVTSNRYGVVDAHDIVQGLVIATENFRNEPPIGDCYIGPDEIHLRIIIPQITETVGTGNYTQAYQAGVYISNGSVKNRQMIVAPFIQGTRCQNSTILFTEDYGHKRNHNGLSVGSAHSFIYDTFGMALKAGPEVMDRIQQAARERMEDPADILRRIATDRGLTPETENLMLQGMWEQGGATKLGLMNGITFAAHTSEDVDHRTRADMEMLAGNILLADPDHIMAAALRLANVGEADDE